MRLSSVFIRVVTFAAAALISLVGARVAVTFIEETSVQAVQDGLEDNGMDWATVIGDGLQIIIEGEAPTEMARLRAVNIAGGVVDASRVINNAGVKPSQTIAAPDFAIEILRNDAGVSLIGLIPATTDRTQLSEQIQDIADGSNVTDLLETGDYPTPDGWRSSLNYALSALEQLPRSKISVAPGQVTITAISDSAEQKRSLEQMLRQRRPDGVELTLMVTAPRPVVSPYITRFSLSEEGATFDACTADTDTARETILSAATEAGLSEVTTCTIALGVPSRTWGDTVAMTIRSLTELGGGTVTLSDTDISLVGAIGTPQDRFDEIVGRLENALPEVYALEATLPVIDTAADSGPAEFSATFSPEGILQLRGKVPDDMTNTLVENFAHAKFAGADLVMATRVADGMPNGWSVRVLAALEALSNLDHGGVTVTPTELTILGQTSEEQAASDISGMLVEKLGQDTPFDLNVTYVEKVIEVDLGPSPEQCVADVNTITDGRKITFDPGSTTLTADARNIMDDIAEVLRDCVDLQIEVAGYTDSQGREEMNLNLSQQRAEAVLQALLARRVPTGSFVAQGYGEADPIADNETEEGREANRRIEFRLVTPDAAPTDETPTEDTPATDQETATEAETEATDSQ